MRKTYCSPTSAKIECINKINDIWVIRFGYNNDDIGDYCFEERFSNKPSSEEIRKTILGHYNQQCDEEILSGFEFEGNLVWLSTENQFNYKAAYDFSFQRQVLSMPFESPTFKLGPENNPVYKTFENFEELTDFITACFTHIQETLNNYWIIKDYVDWEQYEIN